MTNWIRLYDLFSHLLTMSFWSLYSPSQPFSNWFVSGFWDPHPHFWVCARERLKRKENSSKTIHLFSPSPSLADRVAIFLFDVMVVQESWPGSLSLFCCWLSKVFNPPLRIDSPICNHCCYGTFLHFSLQVFQHNKTNKSLSFPSHLNVCYYHQDLYWSRFHARSLLHSSIMITSFYGWSPPFLSPKRMMWDLLLPTASPSPWFQRPPFSGPIHSVGELLHTP